MCHCVTDVQKRRLGQRRTGKIGLRRESADTKREYEYTGVADDWKKRGQKRISRLKEDGKGLCGNGEREEQGCSA